MGKFKFIATELEGLYIIEPVALFDERGYFMETFNYKEFLKSGLDLDFVQDNQSRSKRGVLRGLHYQRNFPQGKLFRVASGEVFDVAVDLRKDSKTFGKWEGVYLSGENRRQFYIPPGFAHGFLVVSESAEFMYKCTGYYNSADECGIIWNDPDIGIEWPLEGEMPALSAKDNMFESFEKSKKLFI